MNHRGSICGVRLGFNFSAESPCELRFCELFLTSDRCVGARVSLRSRRWFFLCGWPPVSCFRNETLTAFFFCEVVASIIKNRPARGGFLFQLGSCGPNTKLCRWYRTFFEILLRFPAFFGPRGVRAGVPCSMHRSRRQGKSHSVEVVRESWNQRRVDERFLATGRSGLKLVFRPADRFGAGKFLSSGFGGELPG